jgi:hypothetical protein
MPLDGPGKLPKDKGEPKIESSEAKQLEIGAGDNNRTEWTRREHEEEIALITGERACNRVFWPPYESYGRALDVKKNSRKTEVG